jgi:hypothetical protein
LTDDTEVAEVDAVAPDTETDVAAEEVAAEEVAPEAPAAEAAEKRFPKVVKRDEEASITHYSPKPHTELDPASRFKD